MIICKSPLRVSLGGGGTDFPEYYRKFGGFLISAAIRKYVYVSVTKPFYDGIFLKYATIEQTTQLDAIKHPIIREALRLLNPHERKIEIVSLADVPAGTGLGSSGSFTTALLKALALYYNRLMTQMELAEKACEIELDILNTPAGKQDQYIAALGGLTALTFHKDGRVDAESLKIKPAVMKELQERLVMFYTGLSQPASDVLKDQQVRSMAGDSAMLENLHGIKEMGLKSRTLLEKGDLQGFARVMHEHWLLKRQRSKGMTNETIDKIYTLGMNNGALGGKLIGAGGRGFVMFLAEDKARLHSAMQEAGLESVSVEFDNEGSRSINS